MTADREMAGAGNIPPPRMEAVWFGGPAYERMARILSHTASIHCPSWAVNIGKIEPGNLPSHAAALPSHVDNTRKMECWNAIIQASADGDRVLLIDADTFITGSLDCIWESAFDIAYTVKTARFPFNSGVVFVRVSDATRRFFQDWAQVNRSMLAEHEQHAPFRAKYGGINQAAFGSMLERGTTGLALLELPCREWNCEDTSWASFDKRQTRIVHVKGALRRHLFERRRIVSRNGIMALGKLWLAQEADFDNATSSRKGQVHDREG